MRYEKLMKRLSLNQIGVNRNEQRGKAVYLKDKTENGGGEPKTSASDSGADTFTLHKGEKQSRLQDISQYVAQRKATCSSQSRRLGLWNSYSADLPYRRHCSGTLTLEAGTPTESIAKMMGRSSIATTQICAKITDQNTARDMERLVKRKNTLKTSQLSMLFIS